MFYRFVSASLPDVVVLRGEGTPKFDSGRAKWEVIDRPKRVGQTRFTGSDPLRMSLPVLFNGWEDDEPVEVDIHNLEQMRTADGTKQPPVVNVNVGSIGGVPLGGVDWVIESIEYGDNAIWDWMNGGRLVRFRQDAVVHLLQYVAADLFSITSKPPGNTRGSGVPPAKIRHYVTKVGDTIPSIAVAQYHGDRSKWKAIARRNHLVGTKIGPGIVLVLP